MTFASIVLADLRAEKLSGNGYLCYSIWSDQQGKHYVSIDKNFGGSIRDGTHPSALYVVGDLAAHAVAHGVDRNSGVIIKSSDNNIHGFLKAIFADIELRRREAQKEDVNATFP